jgi:hypothetical protein
MTVLKRRLLTGEALEKEAERLGVSMMPSGGLTDLYEPELQQRVLAARAECRNVLLDVVQTAAIIGTLVMTLIIVHWNHTAMIAEQIAASRRESTDLILKFDERLNSGASGQVTKALHEYGNLDQIDLSGKALDDALDEFLGNYELLDAANQSGLIDEHMAEDAFSYDLGQALRDRKIRSHMAASKSEKSELYDGVLELAQVWKIPFDPITVEVKGPSILPTH